MSKTFSPEELRRIQCLSLANDFKVCNATIGVIYWITMKLSGVPIQRLDHQRPIYWRAVQIKEGYLLVVHPGFCLLNILMFKVRGIAATTTGVMAASYAYIVGYNTLLQMKESLGL